MKINSIDKKTQLNIWIFCHYAQQPPYNTMLRYHNWGKELVRRGHKVTIVSASTVHNIDLDVIDELNRDNSKCEGIIYRYIRTPKYSGNGMARMKNMLQYSIKLKNTMNHKNKPDVIIVCEAYLYLFAKFFFNDIPIITDIVDLWPESIIEYANVKKINPLIQALYLVEKIAYIKTEALVFSMEGGTDYLIERKYRKKIDFEKVFHINMGCDMEQIDRDRKYKTEEISWNQNHYNIVYCGSIRQANNIKQICDAANEIQKRRINKIDFHIYGNGDELETLQKYVKDVNIKNVFFYGRIEKAKLPYLLSHATANVLTYKQVKLMKYGGSQSKLFDYLSSGRPIICNAKFGYNLIERYDCGIVTKKQTAKAFADAVVSLCSHTENELIEMGKRARKAAEDYDQPILVDRLMQVIQYAICQRKKST